MKHHNSEQEIYQPCYFFRTQAWNALPSPSQHHPQRPASSTSPAAGFYPLQAGFALLPLALSINCCSVAKKALVPPPLWHIVTSHPHRHALSPGFTPLEKEGPVFCSVGGGVATPAP